MRWSNLPTPMFSDEGLRMGAVTSAQRAAVKTLLAVGTQSRRVPQGHRDHAGGRSAAEADPRKVRAAAGRPRMRGRAGAGPRRRARRTRVRRGRVLPRVPGDAFGDRPVDAAIWRSSPGDQSHACRKSGDMAPSLPAAQPATYTVEGRTVRPLGNENDKAFALINALNTGSAARPFSARASPIWSSVRGRTERRFSPRGFARRR